MVKDEAVEVPVKIIQLQILLFLYISVYIQVYGEGCKYNSRSHHSYIFIYDCISRCMEKDAAVKVLVSENPIPDLIIPSHIIIYPGVW